MTDLSYIKGWTLGVKSTKDDKIWWFSKSGRTRYSQTSAWSTNINDCIHFTNLNELYNAYRSISDEDMHGLGDKENIKFFKLETIAEEVDMNEGDVLNVRQRKAIEKLTPDEIEALGLKKIALQNKLTDKIPDWIYDFYPGKKPASPEDYKRYKLYNNQKDDEEPDIYFYKLKLTNGHTDL